MVRSVLQQVLTSLCIFGEESKEEVEVVVAIVDLEQIRSYRNKIRSLRADSGVWYHNSGAGLGHPTAQAEDPSIPLWVHHTPGEHGCPGKACARGDGNILRDARRRRVTGDPGYTPTDLQVRKIGS